MQVSLVASDIASVLERFASGSSFSEQSHGGGRESNSYLLPYLVQLGRYLASCCSASDRQVSSAIFLSLCCTDLLAPQCAQGPEFIVSKYMDVIANAQAESQCPNTL